MHLQQSCFVCIYSKAVLCDHFQGHIWLQHDIYKTGINFPFQYLLSLSDFRGAACFQDTLNPFLQQLHSLYRIDTMFPGKVQPVYFQDECSLFPLSIQPVSKKDVIYLLGGMQPVSRTGEPCWDHHLEVDWGLDAPWFTDPDPRGQVMIHWLPSSVLLCL